MVPINNTIWGSPSSSDLKTKWQFIPNFCKIRHRAFLVTGPMTFSALSDQLCDPSVNTTTFTRLLKTHFFASC